MFKKDKIFKILLLLIDIITLYASLFLSLYVRGASFEYQNIFKFLFYFSFLYIFCLPFLYALDFYEIDLAKNITKFLYNQIVFNFIFIFLGVCYFYLRPSLVFTPKTILFLNLIFFDVIFFAVRLIFVKLVDNIKERIIIFGLPKNINNYILQKIEEKYFLQAFFIPNSLVQNNLQIKDGVKIINDIELISKIIKENKIKKVIFANDLFDSKQVYLEFFKNAPVNLFFQKYSDFYEDIFKKVSLDNILEDWFLEPSIQRENKFYFILKRIIDFIFAGIFLVITILLLPFIAIFIKLDSPGPIFYKQERVGKYGKVFTLYKFRTMVDSSVKDKRIWREKDKNQITRVGYFLRRFHLDELPQSWTIIKGDISFVGPRPEWTKIAEIFEKEIIFYKYRYLITPGFTGWAQINYKPSNSVFEAKEKFEYDLYYAKNRSILFDIEIILKTIRLLLRKDI